MMGLIKDKILSRKLLVVLVAGAAAYLGIVSGDEFQTVLIAYLGAQGLTDAAEKFKAS